MAGRTCRARRPSLLLHGGLWTWQPPVPRVYHALRSPAGEGGAEAAASPSGLSDKHSVIKETGQHQRTGTLARDRQHRTLLPSQRYGTPDRSDGGQNEPDGVDSLHLSTLFSKGRRR